uniref:Solute carrier family 22 member 21 n=1 Tax=Latimeria chalumnae TaxID=7897 RepID=H3AUH5_LATCH
MARDYDEVTSFLGEWGPFQRVIFFLLCASTVFNGLTGLPLVFMADTPDHHCRIPENANISSEWRNVSIPLEEVDGKLMYSKCRRYRLDIIKNYSDLSLYPGVDVNVSEIEQENCRDGWDYSKEQYSSTIVSEWDLVCDDDWKGPLATSLLYVSFLVGAFVTGQLSDRFGRKIVFFGTLAVQVVFSLTVLLSPNWEVFCALYFCVGLGQISNYTVASVLGMEILGKSIRVIFCTLGAFVFYSFGYMLLALFAYFIRGWRMLLLTISLPGLLLIPLWWFIPESPRWLLSQGKIERAEALIQMAARKNKVVPPAMIFTPTEIEEMKSKSQVSLTILDILKSNNVRCITLISGILWMTASAGYFTLSLNTANLHGDSYLNSFLSALIEVPANVATWLLARVFPRRITLSATLFLGSLTLFFIQLVPPDLSILSTVLVMAGKLAVTSAFSMLLIFAVELYPTVIRNGGIGICSTAARAGSIVSPYLVYLGSRNKHLPYIILGALLVLSGLLVLILPETFRKPLPETLAEVQKIKMVKCCLSPHSHENKTKENLKTPFSLTTTSF